MSNGYNTEKRYSQVLDYQIPVTQQKGNGDITQQSEISKRHLHAISIYGSMGAS